MREYIFRGKRKDNGELVEGFYVCLNSKSHRIYNGCAETDCGDYYPAWFEVIPETVGQYTGLTDKNRVKIFEGDIVRTQPFFDKPYSKKAKSTQHIGVVEYIDGDTGAEWRVRIEDYIGYGYCAFSAFHNCEVIGNIHDNPELLKGVE